MKKLLSNIAGNNKGFALNEMIGIVLAFIIAAFIIIPGLRDLSDDVMNKMDDWWVGISGSIFYEE